MISKIKQAKRSILAIGLLSMVITACDSNSDVDLFVEAEEVAALGLSSLSVSSEITLMNADETVQFNVSGADKDGAAISGLGSKVTWATSNEGLATVDGTGLVTAVADGVVTVFASYAYLQAQSSLTINTADLVQINLSGASIIDECKTSEITTRGIFSDGSTREIAGGLSFSVSDSSVVSLISSDNAATLMTHKPGIVTVEATKNQITGALDIEVADALQELLVSPERANVSVSSTAAYVATGIYAGSESVDITASTAWSSVDSAIGAFDTDVKGAFRGIAEGSTTVVAGCGELTANVLIIVNSVTLSSVAINYDKSYVTLDEDDDDGYQLTLRATYSDGTVVDVTEDADWTNITSASGNIVVDDDEDDKGELIITGTGSANIEAEYEGYSDTILVIVE